MQVYEESWGVGVGVEGVAGGVALQLAADSWVSALCQVCAAVKEDNVCKEPLQHPAEIWLWNIKGHSDWQEMKDYCLGLAPHWSEHHLFSLLITWNALFHP